MKNLVSLSCPGEPLDPVKVQTIFTNKRTEMTLALVFTPSGATLLSLSLSTTFFPNVLEVGEP